MKKIVGILAATAMVASTFALDFAGGVQAGVNFKSDGYRFGRSTDNIGTDNILELKASSDVAGGNINLRAKDYNGESGVAANTDGRAVFVDNYTVWVKPAEMLKLTMSSGADFNIFGDGIGYGDGKIGIINDGSGFKAELTPVEGLWIGARVGAPNAAKAYKSDLEGNLKWAAGASYTIDGIGVIGGEFAREGQNGDVTSGAVDYKWNAAMVGFKLTAVENMSLIVDWAGWFFNGNRATSAVCNNAQAQADSMQKIGAFFTYKMDALELGLGDRVILRSYANKVANWDKKGSEFANVLCAKVAYTVNAFTPYAKFGWAMNIGDGTGDEFQARVSAYDNPVKANTLKATVGCDYKVGAATVNAEFTIREYDSCWDDVAGANVSSTTWELPVTFKIGL